MAANSKKDQHEGPGGRQNTGGKDHKPGSSGTLNEAQRKRKQECQRDFNARKKQKMKSTEEQLETVNEMLAHHKGQVHQLEKNMKEARDQTSLKLEHLLETIQQGIRELGNKVGKESALQSNLWDHIERTLSVGTRDWGSTSASSEALNRLKELYTASEVRHAEEMAATNIRHAEEMAATEARHAQEMAATEARHAQEMAAVRAEYGRDVENNGQEFAGPSDLNFDVDTFFADNGDIGGF